MPDINFQCKKCKAQILKRTWEDHNGKCARCAKKTFKRLAIIILFAFRIATIFPFYLVIQIATDSIQKIRKAKAIRCHVHNCGLLRGTAKTIKAWPNDFIVDMYACQREKFFPWANSAKLIKSFEQHPDTTPTKFCPQCREAEQLFMASEKEIAR